MPKLIIDGNEVEAEDGMAIIQACEDAGVQIPRFCYHERLSVAGNCRMCLVEVVGAPKLVASCAVGVNDLRPGPNGELPEIKTNSEKVVRARKGTMEFLLVNHPLDCPICDQGGECDLQDQALAFGGDTSRFKENKRAVENRNIGPLIKTIMTRCISCTRCVRYMTEVAGVNELGQIGRGEGAEISTYLDQAIHSEISGNVIDLCPVGALTSRPYAFSARPWETRKTETIDVMDALGANIIVETRGNEVMRITPRENESVNEEWITDKSRFIWDGLKSQRLDQPYVRHDGRLQPVSWDEALGTIKSAFEGFDPARIGAVAGDMATVEEMYALKMLMQGLGSGNIDCRQDGSALDPALGKVSYRFNSDLEGIDQADVILMVGTNPRLESAVLNARIYRNWIERGIDIGVIGQPEDMCYEYTHLGDGAQSVVQLLEGKIDFAKKLKDADHAMIIVGEGVLARADGTDLLALSGRIADEFGMINESWNGFNILHTAASRVGGLDIGFVPAENGMNFERMMVAADRNELNAMILLGADELDVNRLTNTFVVYIGSHGDQGAQMADVILPGAVYTEKDGTYVNMAGRVQLVQRAAFPPGNAKEDWSIIRALGDQLGVELKFNSLAQLQKLIYQELPHLAGVEQVAQAGNMDKFKEFTTKGLKLESEPFENAVQDFYLTNPIARASAIMAEMSAKKQENEKNDRGGATGTHG